MSELLTRGQSDAISLRSEGERLLDIRLMGWGVIGQTPEGPETFARGAFDATDATRVTIEAGRHGGPLVGRGTVLEQRDDGAYLTARIAPTPAGDELLVLAAERVLPDASVSFYPLKQRRRNGAIERTAVDLRRVAILERGSYPGAGVIAIREQPAPEPDPTPAPEPPAPTPEPFQREVLAELGALRNMIGRAPGADPYLMLREEPGFGEACQRAWVDKDYRDLLTRVMVDEITADNPGVVPPAWLQDVKGILPVRRPAVEAFGGPASLPDSGMSFNWPTYSGDIKALILKQAAEKTALNSVKISFGSDNQPIESFGFVHDVAYQLILRSSPSYVASANRVLLGAFAYYEDNAFITALLAGATGSVVLAAGATADAVKAAFFSASLAVEAATGAPAAFALAGSTRFAELGGLAGLTPSPYGTANVAGTATASTLKVEVSGLPVIHDPFLPPDALIWSNAEAAKWHVDGPRFATAEDVERLGRNDAIWGMGAAAVYIPAGIVEAAAITSRSARAVTVRNTHGLRHA